MTSLETNLSKLRASKYETIANFTLPDSAWWDDYYSPLESKLPTLKETFKNNRIALNILIQLHSKLKRGGKMKNGMVMSFL